MYKKWTHFLLLTCLSLILLLCGCSESEPVLELTENTLELQVYGKYDLNQLVVSEERPFTFQSSDPAVATVTERGFLIAATDGTTDILITSADGKSATCHVTITPILPAKIALSDTKLSLPVQGTARLSVTFTPQNTTERTLTYISDNEAVAIVDANGNITAIASGTATITALTANERSATCIVTVKEPLPPWEKEPQSFAPPQKTVD